MTNTKVSILLYGNVPDTISRSKALIEFFKNSRFKASIVCPDSYTKFTHKISNQLSCIDRIVTWLHLFEFFIKIAFVDVVYLLPSNTRFIPIAILGSKIFNKKLIVEMYVSAYDSLRDRGLFKDNSIQAKLAMAKDRMALSKADYIIHTSSHELLYWAKVFDVNIDQNKVMVAPLFNINSCDYFHTKKFMHDGVLKICWWGTFIPLHGLDNILNAMKILKEKYLDFSCTLFGIDNPYYYEYKKVILEESLDDCVLLRKDLRFSDGSLPNYLSKNCDLALGIFGNTPKALNAIPNKLVEALSMGIPILTMSSPALCEFFEPGIDFWICQPSSESIADFILSIANGSVYPVDWKQTRQKILANFNINQYHDTVIHTLSKAIRATG